MPLTSAGSELCRMFWPFARQLTLREKNDFHIWACFHFFSFKNFALTFIELFDPIPCWLWYVGLILVFCLTSRFRLSSKFSAFPAFIIDNINISAKTLNWKWILFMFNLIRLGKKTTTKMAPMGNYAMTITLNKNRSIIFKLN